MPAVVNYVKKDKTVIITMNRPDRLNALDNELAAKLSDAFKRFENNPYAKVAILTGSGRAFSAGLDLKEMAWLREEPEPQRVDEVMRKITKPLIAAVNGLALGAGLRQLVLQCDVRIAATSATFGMPEIALAVPGVPEPFLAQGIPLCAAMELVLTGEPITAERAYQIGLVNKVVPRGELMPTAMKIAERIAGFSPRALRLIRQAGVQAIEASEEMLNWKQKRQDIRAELLKSGVHREAVRAFVEKRKH